jgi:hypothetical protein
MQSRLLDTAALLVITGRFAGSLSVAAMIVGIFAMFALLLFGAAAGQPRPRQSVEERMQVKRELIRKYAPDQLKDFDAGTRDLHKAYR